jgi:hypothetical protein
MKQLWCEWDIGQEGLVFRNDEAAMRWIRNNSLLREDAAEEGLDYEAYLQGLYDEGLIGLDDLEIIE